jgi:hypothetical protein
LQTSEQAEVPKRKKRSTLGLRSVPSDVVDSMELLEPETKEVLRGCGFSGLLHLQITKNFSVIRIVYMMSKCDVSGEGPSFTIVLSEDNKIEVTPEKVKRVFDLPDGTPDGSSVLNMEKWSTKFEEFKQKLITKGFLKTKQDVVTVAAVNSYIDSVKDDKDEQARAWLYIVLGKLLFPTHGLYILRQHVGMGSDLTWVKNFNWCRYLCQDMKNKIAA